MEQSPKTTANRHCIARAHPLLFPDGTLRRGDVWLTTTGEWYAEYGGVTYAIDPPDQQRRVRVQESRFGGPALKRIEL